MSIPGAASPLFIGAAAAEAGPYQIDRSLRFNADDGAKLTQTFSSAGNRRTFTYSCWVKRAEESIHGTLFARTSSQSDRFVLAFYQGNLYFFSAVSGTTVINVNTADEFRDSSAWYHIVFAWDTTQSTANDRTKFYVNGAQVTNLNYLNQPSLNYEAFINTAAEHTIGHENISPNQNLNAYLAETHFIDGQALAASDFGEYDDNNVWQPKAYSGSYGTNGFKLDFSDNTSTATISEDSSGNNNDWTANNISVTAGTNNDSLIDTPTNYEAGSGNNGGNYCTLNPLAQGPNTALSNGNLETYYSTSSGDSIMVGTVGVATGKWYWEVLAVDIDASNTATSKRGGIGLLINLGQFSLANFVGNNASTWGYYSGDGNKGHNASFTAYGASYSTGDIIGVALDLDAGTLTYYKNNSSQGVAFTGLNTGNIYFPAVHNAYFGRFALNFGQRPFAYTPPTGFKSLCTQNLPDPTIADGSTAMDIALYAGDDSTRSITGLGFSPDMVWIKNRSQPRNPNIWDIVRGAGTTIGLSTNTTNSESDYVSNDGYLSAFNSDGFTVVAGSNANGNVNSSSNSYVGWAWDAGTSTVSNTDGDLTCNVRANASAGISIIGWTGTGSLRNVGHGLNAKPGLIIIKNRDTATDWVVLSPDYLGDQKKLYLNKIDASVTDSQISNATSSLVYLKSTDEFNGNGDGMICYCFAPVAGFSAMGSYQGNGDADGPFVFTGMRPRWVMWKKTSGVSQWALFDTARNPNNLADLKLEPNRANAESTQTSSNEPIDILSNGFKLRGTGGDGNASGSDYFWVAFAEHPFKTARAR